ncbi:MAG: ABC transporter ATP-binding protein [Pseudomonadota bacterium]
MAHPEPELTQPPADLIARGITHCAASGQVLLEDVSFALQSGAILAIAGPNGAGKTTLLNLLSGTVPLQAGEITVAGQALRGLSAPARARLIAVVSQDTQPDGRLSLRDYVALGQIPIQTDLSPAQHAQNLARVLDLTGLAPLADKWMAVLSGGERQRAHIARALAQQPALLFLDEPTNHLDPDAKGRMLSLIADLGITVVMVLHDLVLIPEFATHVALLNAARLVSFGPVTDALTPAQVHATFGVAYLRFDHQGRQVPALDIRKSSPSASTATRNTLK